MSKSDKQVLGFVAVSLTAVLLISWLESSPNCDRGCRTQLEHLKEHVLSDLFNVALAQLGV
jgi:hypothetical protein